MGSARPGVTSRPLRRIGIVSPNAGNGNLGDEATLTAVLASVGKRIPDADVYVVCLKPDETARQYKVATVPVFGTTDAPAGNGAAETARGGGWLERARESAKKHTLIRAALKPLYVGGRFLVDSLSEASLLARCVGAVRGSDLMVVAGSGYLTDQFGLRQPYAAFAWSLAAKLCRTRLVFLSVGAGPLRSAAGRLLVKSALSLADYRSFRDRSSKELVEDMGIGGTNPVFPDPASDLNVSHAGGGRRGLRPVVGINPFPHHDARYWPTVRPLAYKKYVETLSDFAAWLIERAYGVVLFPTQLRADRLVIRDMRDEIRRRYGPGLEARLAEPAIGGLDELTAEIDLTDMVVATRFHGIVLSFLLNKPVLALSNDPKMDDLMIGMGQSEYRMHIDDISLESLRERFAKLEAGRDLIERQLSVAVAENRRALEMQYDLVLGR